MAKHLKTPPAEDLLSSQFLTFHEGGECFAIDIAHVREIIEYEPTTTVPMMPEFVCGVINLRGAVVPVINLSLRFGRQPRAITRHSCIIIVEVPAEEDKQAIGILVDSVCEVVEIPASDIEPPPSFGSMLRSEFISGMGRLNGHFVILLDLNHVLSIEEMAEMAESFGEAEVPEEP